jgi:hypothetical protein
MIGVKLSCIVLFAGLGCAASVDSASMAELQAVRFKTEIKMGSCRNICNFLFLAASLFKAATGGHKSNFQA